MKVHSQGNRSKREYLRIPKPQAIVAGTIPPLNLDKKDAELFVTIKKKNKKKVQVASYRTCMKILDLIDLGCYGFLGTKSKVFL